MGPARGRSMWLIQGSRSNACTSPVSWPGCARRVRSPRGLVWGSRRLGNSSHWRCFSFSWCCSFILFCGYVCDFHYCMGMSGYVCGVLLWHDYKCMVFALDCVRRICSACGSVVGEICDMRCTYSVCIRACHAMHTSLIVHPTTSQLVFRVWIDRCMYF